MNAQDLARANELYFIDIETVNSIGICQIAITKWNRLEQRLSIVFNEILNPEVSPESINRYAIRTHSISEYSWSKAKPFDSFHSRIKTLLAGKIVLQWGGADFLIIQKNITSYKLEDINLISLNSWSYHYKGVKLTTAAEKLGVSYKGLHNASYDSYLAGLLFVSEICGYKITNIDRKIIESFNSRASAQPEKFKVGHLKSNGSGNEVCLTGFTSLEKKKFGELLAKNGFRIRGSVTSGLSFLITPSGSYQRSPSKEAEARRVGAEIIDLNSLLQSL